MEDIKSKPNSRGKIQKIDFIEYSIEAKLLDLTDVSSSRKTVGSKGRGKEGEERITKKDNMQVLCLYLMYLILHYTTLQFEEEEGKAMRSAV